MGYYKRKELAAVAGPKKSVLADLAMTFDALVGYGYREDDLWAMTPGQMQARIKVAQQRYRRQLADQLQIVALAAQGAGKDINDKTKKLLQ
jgi:hypothetical protein